MSPQGQIWALGLVAFSLVALKRNGSSTVDGFKELQCTGPNIVGKKEKIPSLLPLSFRLAALV